MEEGKELISAQPTNTEEARAIAQVQGAIIAAKRFPRNEIEAIERIKTMCQRRRLAENAIYSYPRGKQQIEGPSIRLAEALAGAWGNMECGVVELSKSGGKSTIMSFACDLETNNRVVKTFTVDHVRSTKEGPKQLTDGRDIYEHVANMGARRLRACILAVIPGDVVDEALDVCNQTLAGKSDVPLADRARKMVGKFKEVGVTQRQLEARLMKNLDAITEPELIQMTKIYKSLTDGMSKPADWFGPDKPDIKKPAKKKDIPPELSVQEYLQMMIDDDDYGDAIEAAITDGKIVLKDGPYTDEEAQESINFIKQYKEFLDGETK